MNCNERQGLMLPFAADLLEEDQQAELRAHLAGGCSQCAAVLSEAQTLLNQIPATIDPVSPPVAAVGRLMQRVNADQGRDAVRPKWSWRAMAMAACLGFVVGAVSLYVYQRSQMQELRTLVQSQQLKLIAFAPAQAGAAGSGRIFWDQDRGRWHVYVFDLKPPAAGRTYELWFIKPDNTKIAAGTFDTDAKGRGSTVVQVPADIGPIMLAAITDEPIGGSQQPTGSIHLVGKIE